MSHDVAMRSIDLMTQEVTPPSKSTKRSGNEVGGCLNSH